MANGGKEVHLLLVQDTKGEFSNISTFVDEKTKILFNPLFPPSFKNMKVIKNKQNGFPTDPHFEGAEILNDLKTGIDNLLLYVNKIEIDAKEKREIRDLLFYIEEQSREIIRELGI
jgi:site-specific DNA-adenine methylase